jgi:uncharacterized membrane protein|nr:MAG TPA: holin [Caudoviricetes sp.]
MYKDYLKRFTNPGTILTLASLIVLLLTQCGVKVDNEQVMSIVKTLCSIGIVLGALNNAETSGLDLPFINKDTDEEK